MATPMTYTIMAALSLGLFVSCAEQAAETAPEMAVEEESAQTVVDVIATQDRFSTLASAIESAGLDSLLDADGPYTVFAPTNEAFSALDSLMLDSLLNDDHRLAGVLRMHVVEGMAIDSLQQISEPLSALEGSLTVEAQEDVVYVNGARVLDADTTAANGLVYAIDQVLMPQAEQPAM